MNAGGAGPRPPRNSGQRPITLVACPSIKATRAGSRTRQSVSVGTRLGIRSFSQGRMMSLGPTTSHDATRPRRSVRTMRPSSRSSPVAP